MPSDNEDEKEMEARFERETATAEEWVDVVVDVVGELEDLLDDGDGYDADDDADESRAGSRLGMPSTRSSGEQLRERTGTATSTP